MHSAPRRYADMGLGEADHERADTIIIIIISAFDEFLRQHLSIRQMGKYGEGGEQSLESVSKNPAQVLLPTFRMRDQERPGQCTAV